VQISVPRYFFMVLNSELKGQEKNISFEILLLKLNFASVFQVLRKTLAQVTVFDIFCEKKCFADSCRVRLIDWDGEIENK
jgi:hypothetical protein